MTKEIVQAAQSDALQLTEGKRKQLHRDSVKMYASGTSDISHGHLKRAAFLWNEREVEGHKLEGCETLEEYAERLGISRSNLFGYLQIGDKMRGSLNGQMTGPTLTQKDVKALFELSSGNIKDLTVRGLLKAAKSQESFLQYLTTGEAEDAKQATKLLAPRKLTEDELDKQANDERGKVEAADRLRTSMHSFASQHGIVWDDVKRDWFNEDGTPVTDKQRSEMMHFADGIRPWDEIREYAGDLCAEIYKTLHDHGEASRLYDAQGKSFFQKEKEANHRTIILRLKAIEDMVSHFFAGDTAKAIQAYKDSL